MLNKLNYVFREGIYLIKGTSGIGKSTLLNIISGYTMASGGKVVLHNINKICYMMQDILLFSNLSIKENLMIMYPDNKNMAVLEEKLSDFGLTKEIINERVSNLSGGQIKKVELLLYTIFNDFDVLLLDEPISNLDHKSIRQVEKYIESLLNNNRIVIIVSHLSLTFDIPYTILEIEEGKLKEENE